MPVVSKHRGVHEELGQCLAEFIWVFCGVAEGLHIFAKAIPILKKSADMGSRLPKPEFASSVKQKAVEFKPKFSEESAIELRFDSQNSSFQNSPIARKKRSLSLPVLSVDCILGLLKESKEKGSEVYVKLKDSHLEQRKTFRLGLGDWGNFYENWCDHLQTSYLELLEKQRHEQEDALHQASLEVLQDFDTTEKELEDSLRLYISHPEIAQGLLDMNDFQTQRFVKISVEHLFEILHFRTERAETLRRSLSFASTQMRLLLIKSVVEDETVLQYGYDDLALSGSIKSACEEMDLVWQERLEELQVRFSVACS